MTDLKKTLQTLQKEYYEKVSEEGVLAERLVLTDTATNQSNW